MPRDLRELEEWIDAHPRLAWVYTIGVSLLVCELGLILNQLAKGCQSCAR